MRYFSSAILVMTAVSLGGYLAAQDAKPAPAAGEKPVAAGPEVTLKGVLLWEKACVPDEKSVGDGQVLFALEGTPEVNAEMDKLMKDYYSGDSLNADQAVKVLKRFNERLKYYIVPGDIVGKKDGQYPSLPKAVTGVISEEDGRKWVTVSKCEDTMLKYPDKMLAPDKPFLMPGKDPLILKVNDALSLKCIRIPPGEFLMGSPFYLVPRWQDEYPHLVTLTKPYYLAEIPVTQEMYEAVMGNNPSPEKDPKLPVENVPCADILKFCQILSEKNGRKVHLPTTAEWEYAARVGTSSPPFNQKYKDQSSEGPKRNVPLPVKSRQPNAWGLYDMPCGVWFEIVSDRAMEGNDRTSKVDPSYPCTEAEKAGKKHAHLSNGGRTVHSAVTHEAIPESGLSYTGTKFRIAVDATPEEIVRMEQAAKK